MWRRLDDHLLLVVLIGSILTADSCSGSIPTPQDRSRVFGAATLVSHAAGLAVQGCLEHSNEMMRAGHYEDGLAWRKRCDADASGVWSAVSRALEKQEDGQLAPCEVRDAARSLDDMQEGRLPAVQDALAEARWAADRCR